MKYDVLRTADKYSTKPGRDGRTANLRVPVIGETRGRMTSWYVDADIRCVRVTRVTQDVNISPTTA